MCSLLCEASKEGNDIRKRRRCKVFQP
uniref:Uncharacterized protein n=1 Tax=Arundo donax TaxID=35708 RepID=A0A0A8YSH7_ARUDO